MRIKLKNAFKFLVMRLLTLHLGILLASFLEDIFIFSGLGFIIWATFLLSKIAGIYVLGVCLVIIGVYIARSPVRRE